jgi:hypothetical protein
LNEYLTEDEWAKAMQLIYMMFPDNKARLDDDLLVAFVCGEEEKGEDGKEKGEDKSGGDLLDMGEDEKEKGEGDKEKNTSRLEGSWWRC